MEYAYQTPTIHPLPSIQSPVFSAKCSGMPKHMPAIRPHTAPDPLPTPNIPPDSTNIDATLHNMGLNSQNVKMTPRPHSDMSMYVLKSTQKSVTHSPANTPILNNNDFLNTFGYDSFAQLSLVPEQKLHLTENSELIENSLTKFNRAELFSSQDSGIWSENSASILSPTFYDTAQFSYDLTQDNFPFSPAREIHPPPLHFREISCPELPPPQQIIRRPRLLSPTRLGSNHPYLRSPASVQFKSKGNVFFSPQKRFPLAPIEGYKVSKSHESAISFKKDENKISNDEKMLTEVADQNEFLIKKPMNAFLSSCPSELSSMKNYTNYDDNDEAFIYKCPPKSRRVLNNFNMNINNNNTLDNLTNINNNNDNNNNNNSINDKNLLLFKSFPESTSVSSQPLDSFATLNPSQSNLSPQRLFSSQPIIFSTPPSYKDFICKALDSDSSNSTSNSIESINLDNLSQKTTSNSIESINMDNLSQKTANNSIESINLDNLSQLTSINCENLRFNNSQPSETSQPNDENEELLCYDNVCDDDVTQPTPPKSQILVQLQNKQKNSSNQLTKLLTKSTFIGKYMLIDKIGEGTYGHVHKGLDPHTDTHVAIKTFLNRDPYKGVPQNTLREIRAFQYNSHPGLLNCIEVLQTKSAENAFPILHLVTPFIDSDLKGYIQNTPHLLTHDKVRSIMRQLVNAVSYLNWTLMIMHRDLKPANILLAGNGIVKIADFGMSRHYKYLKLLTPQVVTLWYRAPEILLNDSYDYAVDVWSLGCIWAELYNKIPLFEGNSEVRQLASIIEKIGLPSQEKWPSETISYNQFKNKSRIGLRRSIPTAPENAINALKLLLQFCAKERIDSNKIIALSYFSLV